MEAKHHVKYAVHPKDFKNYDTSRIREEFLVTDLFSENEIHLVYSHFDRMIIGGIVPKTNLKLKPIPVQKTHNFLDRRELGVVNIGKKGFVNVDGQSFELDYLDALYVGKGAINIEFQSEDNSNPAKFYINSALAHRSNKHKLVKKPEAEIEKLGDSTHSNTRELHKYIIPKIVDTCQLMMGVTHCKENNVWNTMPCHTHELRMEAYMYFNFPDDEQVCHIMGEPDETRNVWLNKENAILSPPWSIHTAAGTTNYSFVWGMAGSDSDMDFVDKQQLK